MLSLDIIALPGVDHPPDDGEMVIIMLRRKKQMIDQSHRDPKARVRNRARK